MTDSVIETDDVAQPGRRGFIVAGAASGSADAAAYPELEMARPAALAPGAALDFADPDPAAPAG